ncbi:hypothetical protein GCM10009347_23570 [Shewanella algicola]|nr:hypothetical protein GCM10009347_23570 [Shewanella algicola]
MVLLVKWRHCVEADTFAVKLLAVNKCSQSLYIVKAIFIIKSIPLTHIELLRNVYHNKHNINYRYKSVAYS